MSTPKVYFSKVILNNAFMVGGKPVPFQPVPGNEGIIELEPEKDSQLITALNSAADNGQGGVLRITASEFEQKKTLAGLRPSAPPRKEMLRTALTPSPFNTQNTGAPAAPPAEASSPAVPVVTLAPPSEPEVAPASEPAAQEAPAPAANEAQRPVARRITRKPALESIPAV